MRLRQAIGVVILSAIVLATYATASPQDAGTTDAVEQGREMIRDARLEIVQTELQLSNDEASAFWPVYFAYSAERDAIQDRNAAMIAEYLRRYDQADLTDEYADELIVRHFAIKTDLLDLQQAYVVKFRDVLPALKVVRLYQLENKVAAEVDAQLAIVVPLADPE